MSRTITLVALLVVTSLISACGGPGKLPNTKVGKPYVINGQSYYPSYDPTYDKVGIASWYGPGFHGKYTASGEVYDQDDLTAAHPTLPMPSLVRVTNLKNGKELVVRINDRGPFTGNRLIDLSKASAKKLGITGLAEVRVQFLERETQNYINMARANAGEIIPMAEYHRRSAEFATAQKLGDDIVGYESSTTATPAPTMTVAQNDILTQKRTLTAEEQQPIQADLPNDDASFSMPRLFVREARAEEVYIAEATPSAGNDEIVFPREASGDEEAGFGRYTIQVGAFASEENVHRLVRKLQPIGETMIDQVMMGGRQLWRVRLGGFAERDYASEVLRQVRAHVPDAKVVLK